SPGRHPRGRAQGSLDTTPSALSLPGEEAIMGGATLPKVGRVGGTILLLALLAIGCRGAPTASGPAGPRPAAAAASSSPTAMAPLLKTRSAYTTISAAAAPWWVALDGGYFREQGLDVELLHVDA